MLKNSRIFYIALRHLLQMLLSQVHKYIWLLKKTLHILCYGWSSPCEVKIISAFLFCNHPISTNSCFRKLRQSLSSIRPDGFFRNGSCQPVRPRIRQDCVSRADGSCDISINPISRALMFYKKNTECSSQHNSNPEIAIYF